MGWKSLSELQQTPDKGFHILVVEDSDVNRTVLCRQIKPYYTIHEAVDGIECMSMLEALNIDLILLDLRMPKMSGFEVLEQVQRKNFNPPVPIIVVSSMNNKEDVIHAFNLGASDFISKPFSDWELMARLRAHVRLRGRDKLLNRQTTALVQNNIYTERILGSIPEALLALSCDMVRSANHGFTQLFGFEAEGMTIRVAFERAGIPEDIVQMIESGVFVTDLDVEFIHPRKGRMFLNISHIQIFMEEDRLLLMSDVTARKIAELALVDARDEAERANAAKSEFLANMSHELRTPLHGILSFSNFGVTKIGTVSKEKLVRYFRNINSSGERLLLLLNDLLDLSKLEADKMAFNFTQQDLVSLVDVVIFQHQALLEEKQLTVETEVQESLPPIDLDIDRMRQVVNNIVANAIQYTLKNTRILFQLRLQKTQNEPVLAPLSDDREVMLLSISDQGVGIPSAELLSVFDEFVQSSKTKTNAGGTGLGLAITKRIVEQHCGLVWAENNAHGGATFHVALPLRVRRPDEA